MGYRIQLLLAQFLAKCSHKIEANGEDADHLDEGELGREEDIVGEGLEHPVDMNLDVTILLVNFQGTKLSIVEEPSLNT